MLGHLLLILILGSRHYLHLALSWLFRNRRICHLSRQCLLYYYSDYKLIKPLPSFAWIDRCHCPQTEKYYYYFCKVIGFQSAWDIGMCGNLDTIRGLRHLLMAGVLPGTCLGSWSNQYLTRSTITSRYNNPHFLRNHHDHLLNLPWHHI